MSIVKPKEYGGVTAYWTEEGRIVTSTFYRPALPEYMAAIVANADSEIEPICTICCRDHHDQVNGTDVSNGGPKFDPRRANHQHYRHDSAGGLVNAIQGAIRDETGIETELLRPAGTSSCELVTVAGANAPGPSLSTETYSSSLSHPRSTTGSTFRRVHAARAARSGQAPASSVRRSERWEPPISA